MRAQIVLFEGFELLDVVAPYEVLWAGGLASGSREHRELVPVEDPGACYGLRCSEAVGERTPGSYDWAKRKGLEGPRGRGIMMNANHATVLVDDAECELYGITR